MPEITGKSHTLKMKPVSQGTHFPYDAYTLNNVSEMAHFPKVLCIPESIPAASLVQDLLVRNFNEQTVPEVMCTNTVNVSWEGKMSPGPNFDVESFS